MYHDASVLHPIYQTIFPYLASNQFTKFSFYASWIFLLASHAIHRERMGGENINSCSESFVTHVPRVRWVFMKQAIEHQFEFKEIIKNFTIHNMYQMSFCYFLDN